MLFRRLASRRRRAACIPRARAGENPITIGFGMVLTVGLALRARPRRWPRRSGIRTSMPRVACWAGR